MAEHELFDSAAIPEISGPGPSGCYCPFYIPRRELWHYALALVDDPHSHWCEFGVGEGESLDWFAMRKPRGNLLFGFDHFRGLPEQWTVFAPGTWAADVYRSNRPDVVIVDGLFAATLTPEQVDKIGRIGFLHMDCDLYSSTRLVLERLAPRIETGTIIVFDEFYNFPGWQVNEAQAFFEFVTEHALQVEYIARSAYQVAVRILGRGRRASWRVRACDWVPKIPGVVIR